MKIAYIILCHKNSLILKELIHQLKDENIYIHVDKKSDISNFNFVGNNIKLIKNRVDVRWGQYSTIEAILNLIMEANKKDYDYICLLSGDCLPLKYNEDIKQFLKNNKGKEFIGVVENDKEKEKRLKYIYNNYSFKKNKNFFEKVLFKLQYKFGLYKKNKYYKTLGQLNKGPTWFILTKECIDYLLEYLDENENFIKGFKYGYCADEMFFQTIICNSKYKKNIYKINESEDDNFMALRYIDWTTGPDLPRTLNETDFLKIKEINKNLLFGRKFNDQLDFEKYHQFLNENSKIKRHLG